MKDCAKFIERCENKISDKFKTIDEIAYFNQVKVLNAFSDNKIAVRHFNGQGLPW